MLTPIIKFAVGMVAAMVVSYAITSLLDLSLWPAFGVGLVVGAIGSELSLRWAYR